MTDTPAPKITIHDWIEHHMSYKTKVIIIGVLALVVIFLAVYGYDLRNKYLAQMQESATLKQDYQQFKNSAVTKNDLGKASDVQAQGQQVFGKDVTDFMKQERATIQSLTQALGQVQGQLTGLQNNLNSKPFGQQQNQATGSLSGYTLDEARPAGAPSLSSINLWYDPSKRDPQAAFQGTTWYHNREDFSVATGEWQSAKDGGLVNTVTLKRAIFKPDPVNLGTWIPVGTENIPITGANTIYTPKGITQGKTTPTYRWTALVGAGRNTVNGIQHTDPLGLLDFRVTDRVGIGGGVANGGLVGSVSFRFSLSK